MTSFRRYRISVRLLLAALCLLTGPWSAQAGTYDVAVPTTSWPGWWSQWLGTSRYELGENNVNTGAGSYVIGSLRTWRLDVPDVNLRMVGGRLNGVRYTPNSAFSVEVRQGNRNGAMQTVYASLDNGPFAVGLPGGDWLEFGLLARASTTAAEAGGNRATLTGLIVSLEDAVLPELAPTALPPAGWLGDGCVGVAWNEADRGGGLRSSLLQNVTTGAVVDAWNNAPGAGLAPGPASLHRSACIPGASQPNGTSTFLIRTTDWAGGVREHSFQARFDRVAPRLGEPAPLEINAPNATLSIQVTDAESGLREVTARLAGAVLPVQSAGGGLYRVGVSGLTRGSHILRVTGVDTVGNSATIERAIRVSDITPPVLQLHRPGASGSASAVLELSAADPGSGIAPASWQLVIDGDQVQADGTETRLQHALERLAAGTHVIEASVADQVGNRARLRHMYEVVDTTVPAAAAAGGRSGIFVSGAPRQSVPWGTQLRLVVTAAERGRALSTQRVLVSQGGRQLAAEVTDARGAAELFIRMVRPEALVLELAGGRVPASALKIQVRPRITLAVAATRPRVGQSIVVRGTVRPGLPGRRLALEARIGGSWYPLRRMARIGRRGVFVTRVTSATPGDVAIRVVLPGAGGWSDAASNIAMLHVRR